MEKRQWKSDGARFVQELQNMPRWSHFTRWRGDRNMAIMGILNPTSTVRNVYGMLSVILVK
jgi:hypothetical protein